jgi:MFS family permease
MAPGSAGKGRAAKHAGQPDYVFKPHEQPMLLGSPYNPDHPVLRMWGYGLIGTLAGITAGLGNGLISANLSSIQGSLGLYSDEVAWLPTVYVMANVCSNLVLVKCRQQFGLQPFVRAILAAYALTTLAHLFVHEFWTAILLRVASGIAASGLTTICILIMMQAMPPPKRLFGVLLGISVSQLALPIARIVAPSLLEWGDWRMTYCFELGLTLACLAALIVLPLPPSDRQKVFEKADLVTLALFCPGVICLCAVLGLGRILWWTEAPWIAYALILAIVLIPAALIVEHYRTNPLLATRWLGSREMVRIALVAIAVRILVSEQTYGSIGLLTVLGMGTDQFPTLYAVILAASVAGIAAALFTFDPKMPGRAIRVACICIAVGAFLDAGATNLTRPANLYLSQGLIAFGALLFIGPAMIIGLSRTLLAGPRHFISWIVIFGATQNLGGLLGSAVFGTFQTLREKFHSHELVQQIVTTDPLVAQRIAGTAANVGGAIADPALRNAEGGALLALQVAREANILAFNDVFLVIGFLACVAFLWGALIQFRIWRRGETSPVILLAERLRAMAAAQQNQTGPRA